MRGIQSLSSALLFAVFVTGPMAGFASAAERRFVPPVTAPVSRGFEAPSSNFTAGHRGIDYQVPSGTPVAASGAGTATFAGPVGGDGLFVTIDHSGGIQTTYSFLSRLDVVTGSAVGRGQIIGLSGAGHPGGPEGLHFGARFDGRYIDPRILLGDFDDLSDILGLEETRLEHRPGGAGPQFTPGGQAPMADSGGSPPGMPAVSGPQVGGPQVGGPQVGGPQVGGPQVEGPQVGGPQVGGPQVGGPQVGGPQVGSVPGPPGGSVPATDPRFVGPVPIPGSSFPLRAILVRFPAPVRPGDPDFVGPVPVYPPGLGPPKARRTGDLEPDGVDWLPPSHPPSILRSPLPPPDLSPFVLERVEPDLAELAGLPTFTMPDPPPPVQLKTPEPPRTDLRGLVLVQLVDFTLEVGLHPLAAAGAAPFAGVAKEVGCRMAGGAEPPDFAGMEAARKAGRPFEKIPPPNDNIVIAVAGITTQTESKDDLSALYQDEWWHDLGYEEGDFYYFSYTGLPETLPGEEEDLGPFSLHKDYSKEETYEGIPESADALGEQIDEIQRRHPGRTIDIVAHSQGGAVAQYYATYVYDQEDTTAPMVEYFVSISSPHHGTEGARGYAILNDTPWDRVIYPLIEEGAERMGLPRGSAPSAMQLDPDSDFIRDGLIDWDPEKVKTTNIATPADFAVPAHNTRLPGARHYTSWVNPFSAKLLAHHGEVVGTPETKAIVYNALRGTPSRCTGYWDAVANHTTGPTIGVLTSLLLHGVDALNEPTTPKRMPVVIMEILLKSFRGSGMIR